MQSATLDTKRDRSIWLLMRDEFLFRLCGLTSLIKIGLPIWMIVVLKQSSYLGWDNTSER
jgi:hypothetical protein